MSRDLHAEYLMLARTGAGPRATVHPDGTFDASAALYALACAAVWANWREQDFVNLALDPENLGCRHVWKGRATEEAAAAWARGTFAEATAFVGQEARTGPVRASTRTTLVQHLEAVLAAAESLTWDPRTRPGLLAVLEAHRLLALRAGTAIGYGASERDLAIEAGITNRTRIRKHNKTLTNVGILNTFDDDSTAWSRYTLHVPVEMAGSDIKPSRRGVDPDVGHDAWMEPRRNAPTSMGGGRSLGSQTPHGGGHRSVAGGLGKSAWMTHVSLDDSPRPAPEVAHRIGRARPDGTVSEDSLESTQRWLNLLKIHGLALSGKRGWRRGTASLDAVARRIGTTGIRARREAAHEAERAARNGWRPPAEPIAFVPSAEDEAFMQHWRDQIGDDYQTAPSDMTFHVDDYALPVTDEDITYTNRLRDVSDTSHRAA